MTGPVPTPGVCTAGERRVCYALSYYCPDYVRTRVLLNALEKADGLRLYRAVNSSRGFLRYLQTLSKLMLLRMRYHPDVYVLGFRGYEMFWPVRVITRGKPLVLDHMMSPYDSLRYEKRRIRSGSLIEKLLFWYEKSMLERADLILSDTSLSKTYLSETFQVDPSKIHIVPISTDETVFSKPSMKEDRPHGKASFEILFYGSFLPLHGIDVILNAASLVRDAPVRFSLIGGKRGNLRAFHTMVNSLGLKNVQHQQWVAFEDLPRLISRADLCLGGPFGGTGQARRVITGKTFQFLAMARATVIGLIDADYGFADKCNCLLVPQRDPEALAAAIIWGLYHRGELEEIGQEGWNLYQRQFSSDSIVRRLETVLRQ